MPTRTFPTIKCKYEFDAELGEIDPDYRIYNAILAAHRRNVAIRFISDNDKAEDLGSDIQQLG